MHLAHLTYMSTLSSVAIIHLGSVSSVLICSVEFTEAFPPTPEASVDGIKGYQAGLIKGAKA